MYLETTVYRTGLPRPHAQRAGVYAQNHENDVERWTLCLRPYLQGRIGRPMALFFAFSRPLAEGWPGSARRWPKLQLSTLHTVAFDHEPRSRLVTKLILHLTVLHRASRTSSTPTRASPAGLSPRACSPSSRRATACRRPCPACSAGSPAFTSLAGSTATAPTTPRCLRTTLPPPCGRSPSTHLERRGSAVRDARCPVS